MEMILNFLRSAWKKKKNKSRKMSAVKWGFGEIKFCSENDFERITYTEAIDILKESNHNKKKKFQYLIEGWGIDCKASMKDTWLKNILKNLLSLPIIRKRSKHFTCAKMMMGKPLLPWISLRPASGRSLADHKEKSALTIW